MSVRPILRIGDPRLREVAQPVERVDAPEISALIDDMFDTMHAANGAGLAAPQIGVPLRVMIFEVANNPRYPNADAVPATVLINPEYEILSDERAGDWEGCLSVPGMRGYVIRPQHIRYWGIDANGNRIERDVQGFHATVFQHEQDHLDGILYPDLIEDPTKFGFIEELVASGQIAAVTGE